MKNTVFLLLFLFSAQFSFAQTTTWTEAWRIEDLPNPESVVYDNQRNVIYVSNQNLDGAPGEASIGKISTDGKIITSEWVKGLIEPKGIAVRGNQLFVSDLTALVEIDIEESKIVRRYPGLGARFLNDVAIDSSGDVYVSDMFNSSIYKLENDSLELWLEDPSLQNPNGLLIQGDNLLVSAWGSFTNGKPATAEKGSVLSVSLEDKVVQIDSKLPIGNLDGLQVYGEERFLISDWITGDIFEYEKGVAKRILDLEQSTGDILFIPETSRLLVPMAKQGQVIAFEPSQK